MTDLAVDAGFHELPPQMATTASVHPGGPNRPDHVARHRRNIASLTGSQILTWGVTLIWTFVVPRRLGPSAWGMLVTASAISGILGVLMGCGTRNYLTRELVRSPGSSSQLIATALCLRLLLIVPACALLALTLHLMGFGATQMLVVAIASAVVILTLLAEPLQAVFQSVERMEFLAASTMLDKIGQAVGAVVLVLLGFGVVAISLWWLAITAALLAVSLLWARRFIKLTIRTSRDSIRGMVRASLPYWSMGLFLTFYLWVDSAMLAVMTTDTEVGWYGVSTRLFGTLLFAATILSTAWLPRFVAAYTHSEVRLRVVARVPFEQILIVSFPIALGAAAVAGPLIHSLYGPGYDGAVPAMILLAFCVLPLYVNIMAQQILVASGRQAVWTKVMMAAAVINPLLNLIAIRVTKGLLNNGAVGAAASLLATELLISTVSVVFVMRGFLIRPSAHRVIRAFGAALGMVAVVYLVRGGGLLGQVITGMVSFTALAVILRVPSAEESQAAVRTISRLGRRGKR